MTSRYFSGYFVFVDDPSRVSRTFLRNPPFLRVEDGKNWWKSREKCVNRGAATRSIVTRREKKGKRGGGKERETGRCRMWTSMRCTLTRMAPWISRQLATNITSLSHTPTDERRVCACWRTAAISPSSGALRHVGNSISSGRADDTIQGSVSRWILLLRSIHFLERLN